MPKAPKSPGAAVQQRHNPLAEEYTPSDPWKSKPAKRQKRNKEEKEDDKFVDSKSSRKILDIGRELEEEDERERRVQRQEGANPAFDFESRMGEEDLVDDEEVAHIEDDDEAWGEDDEEVEEVEIDANDLAAWNKFIPTDENPIVWPGEEAQPQGPGTDLAALILEKIAAHEASDGAVKQPREILGGGDAEDAVELPAKVVDGNITQSLHHLRLLIIHSLLEDRPHHVPLQVWQTAQTLQDPTHNPRLGNPPRHHTPRELDAQRHVRRNPHLHLVEAPNRANLPQHRPPARRPRQYQRDTQAQRPLLQRAEESALQTQRILQGSLVPLAHRRRMHPTRSRDNRLRRRQGLRPRPALRRRPPSLLRNRRRANVQRPRRRRPLQHLHQDLPREEIRAPIQGHRRRRLPLPALPRRGHCAGRNGYGIHGR